MGKILEVDLSKRMGIPTSHMAVKDSLTWLDEEVQRSEYGEVGVIFTMHAGRVVGIEKVDRKKYRPSP